VILFLELKNPILHGCFRLFQKYIGIPDIMEKLCFLMFRGDCNTRFVKLDFKRKRDDFLRNMKMLKNITLNWIPTKKIQILSVLLTM
jgi:hypothetical protein